MTQNTQAIKWATLIRKYRLKSGASQALFGKSFGVTSQAVSQWESGKREAPYVVTWWVHMEAMKK